MGNCVQPGTDAVVVTGCCGTKVICGKSGFVFSYLEQHVAMSVGARSYEISVDALERMFVEVNVDATCSVQPDFDRHEYAVSKKVPIYATVWIGQSQEEIDDSIRGLLEGHMRTVISKMSIEELKGDKNALGQMIESEVKPDLARVGLKFAGNGFKIQELNDPGGVLDALGVVRDTEAKMDADIKSKKTECENQVKQAAAQSRTDIQTNMSKTTARVRNYKQDAVDYEATASLTITKEKKEGVLLMKEHQIQVVRDEQQAEANFADRIAAASRQIDLVAAEKEQLLREQVKQVGIQTAAVLEQRQQLVKKAESHLRQSRTSAEQTISRANGDANALMQIETRRAESKARQAKNEAAADKAMAKAECAAYVEKARARAKVLADYGEAEVGILREKAEAYSQFDSAIVVKQVADAMPKIAARLSAPLAQVENIVFIKGGRMPLAKELVAAQEILHAIADIGKHDHPIRSYLSALTPVGGQIWSIRSMRSVLDGDDALERNGNEFVGSG